MAITIMRRKGQITLPSEVRKAARLEEGILLRPKKVIDASQAWFWTPEWQKGEAEADADIAAGRVVRMTDEEFLDFLDR